MWPLEFHTSSTPNQSNLVYTWTSWQLFSLFCLFVHFVLLKYWWMSMRQLSFCCPSPPLGLIADSQEDKWGFAKQKNHSKIVWNQGGWIRVPSLTMPSFLLSRSQWVSWLVKKKMSESQLWRSQHKGVSISAGLCSCVLQNLGIEVLSDQAKVGVLGSVQAWQPSYCIARIVVHLTSQHHST